MRDWITSETQTTTAAKTLPPNTAEQIARLQTTIEKVIKGKPEVVKLALVTLMAQGHLLIEDVPGIGKTTLSNALARALDLSFQRIQFTSDLLPSDVIGLSIFNRQSGNFEWKAGPIFANIVLADEINRATPKTQSALLEAMAEGQVTTEGLSRPLPLPFMVIATQNPTEHHGTYPLPESQLDRFMLRLHIGYPSAGDERQILRDRERKNPLNEIRAVMSEEDVTELQRLATEVRVDETLIDYLLQIVAQTRETETIELGISPRGSLALFRSAQALALVEGRDFCIADDIKQLILPCFAHRLIVSSRYANVTRRTHEAENLLQEILLKTQVPV
ncbi:MAG: AAA family ATPase [Pyrinomonadaceae bacterium]